MNVPETIKTNARYRGPRESMKQSNHIRDFAHDIQVIQEKFKECREVRKSLQEGIQNLYHRDIGTEYVTSQNEIKAVKGGEL